MCLIIFTVLETEFLLGAGNEKILRQTTIYIYLYIFLYEHSLHTENEHLKEDIAILIFNLFLGIE